MANLNRIKEILEERNISISEFCKEINMSLSGFKRILEKNSTRLQTLETIADALNCPVGIFFNDARKNEKKENGTLLKPHIPISAQAGSLSGFSSGITPDYCEMNGVIKSFGQYDYTIDVKGDSMLPEYHSGDTVACKMAHPGESIWFGRVYVLDTADGVIMKKVERFKQDPSKIRCISLNSAYEPLLLSLEDIYSMGMVVGILKQI